MKTIRCILLDMGKVLVDFNFIKFAARMTALTGLEPEQLRPVIMGDDLAPRYESGKMDSVDFHKEICRRIGQQIPFAEFADAWNSIFSPEPLLPDNVLSALARNSSLWILSNTNPLHFGFVSGRYSFMRHFRGHVVSHEVGVAKPDPRIFVHALAKAGARADETLFVDDALPNVEAAKDLGIDAFQFLNLEHFSREMNDRRLL